MTSTSTHLGFATEPSSHDDKMEMATSPYRQPDDINLDDFDAMQDHSVDNSMLGDADLSVNDIDAVQDNDQIQYQDDDMLDEEYEPQPDQQIADLYMEEHIGMPVEDDEILYEEEASVHAIPEITTELAGDTNESTHSEAPVEVVEDMFEDMEKTEQLPDTNIDASTSQPIHAKDHTDINHPLASDIDESARETVTNTNIVDFAESRVEEHDSRNTTHEATSSGIDLGRQSSGTAPSSAVADESEIVEPNINGGAGDEDPHVLVELEDTTEATNAGSTSLHRAATPSHPVKVMYLEEEMSLFPPVEGDPTTTFFLQDSDLASQSIDKLLAACREVLGESLGHEDELVLDVPALGLHICEDSKYAAQLTLAQVLEVYLVLSGNESQGPIEPLYCTLSSRVCLATQYAYLAGAAREGKTYSEIAADYAVAQDLEDRSYTHTETHDEGQPATISADVLAETEAQAMPGHETEHEDDTNVQIATSSGNADQTVQTTSDTSGVEHAQATQHEQTEEAGAYTEVAVPEDDIDDEKHHEDAEAPNDITDLVAATEPHEVDEQLYIHEDEEKDEFEDQDTASSHTLEGEMPVVQQTSLELQAENTSYDQASVDVGVESEIVNEELDFGDDDELYDPQDVDLSTSANPNIEAITQLGANGNTDNVSASGSAKDTIIETSQPVDQDIGDKQFDEALPTVPEGNPPQDEPDVGSLTPSRNGNTKRKAIEDDDDLDFIELSTPEPKRTRPS